MGTLWETSWALGEYQFWGSKKRPPALPSTGPLGILFSARAPDPGPHITKTNTQTHCQTVAVSTREQPRGALGDLRESSWGLGASKAAPRIPFAKLSTDLGPFRESFWESFLDNQTPFLILLSGARLRILCGSFLVPLRAPLGRPRCSGAGKYEGQVDVAHFGAESLAEGSRAPFRGPNASKQRFRGSTAEPRRHPKFCIHKKGPGATISDPQKSYSLPLVPQSRNPNYIYIYILYIYIYTRITRALTRALRFLLVPGSSILVYCLRSRTGF